MKGQEAKRRCEQAESGVAMDKEQYRDWQRKMTCEWKERVPDVVKQMILSDVRAARLQAALSQHEDDQCSHSSGAHGRVDRTFIDEYGTPQSPVGPQVFSQHIRKELGLPLDADEPGFYRYERILRSKQQPSMFVAPREGGLRRQDKVKYQNTCSQAHPGLCATEDAAIISACRLAADELRKY